MVARPLLSSEDELRIGFHTGSNAGASLVERRNLHSIIMICSNSGLH
jgi:hypothetical protein